MPLISIIIPCYNSKDFILKTIDSVTSQTFQNWECIIIDDGSTDNLFDLVKVKIKNDNRFTYFHQKNKGLSKARNKGIELASGDFFYFLDADDLLDTHSLYHVTLPLKEVPDLDIIFGKTSITNGHNNKGTNTFLNHNLIEKQVLKNESKNLIQKCILNKISCVAHNRLYSKKLIIENNLRFKDNLLHEDELWFFETLFFCKQIYLIDEITYYYNCSNNDSITHNFTLNNIKSYLEIFLIIKSKYFSNPIHEKFKNIIGIHLVAFQSIMTTHCLSNINHDDLVLSVSIIQKCFDENKIHQIDFSSLQKKEYLFLKTVNKIINKDSNIFKVKEYCKYRNTRSIKKKIKKNIIEFKFLFQFNNIFNSLLQLYKKI